MVNFSNRERGEAPPPPLPPQGGKVRTIVATAGVSAATAALSGFHDWVSFLAWAASAGGAGVVVFWLIQGLDKYVLPPQAAGWKWRAAVKYYSSMALALLVPPAAYVALASSTGEPWDQAKLVGAAFVGFQVARTIHWEGDEAGGTPPAATSVLSTGKENGSG